MVHAALKIASATVLKLSAGELHTIIRHHDDYSTGRKEHRLNEAQLMRVWHLKSKNDLVLTYTGVDGYFISKSLRNFYITSSQLTILELEIGISRGKGKVTTVPS